ncbi:hypothetical protein MWU59_12880 [Flavobacteriaceae bacterium F08102]|nr:hypothetical protein [Flavobacteriaceae bacterium F08102]
MKKLIHPFINCITIDILAFFAIPKFLRKDQHTTAVERFDYAIDLNADFFRICTEISKLKVTITALVFTFNQHKHLAK